MVREAKGRLFKRKDGKYLIYVPLRLAEDSMFPFKIPIENETKSIRLNMRFEIGKRRLIVEPNKSNSTP